MRYHPGAGFEAMRDRKKQKYEINPIPFVFAASIVLWIAIDLAVFVVVR